MTTMRPTPTSLFQPARLGALAMALLLAACATPQAPTRPELALPERWTEAASNSPAAVLDRQWWRGFQSDELVGLIDQALAGSPDLRIAAERVTQAELSARLAGASLFPQLSAGANTALGYSDSSRSAGQRSESTAVSLGLSYEVDLWGRVAAVTRGANASLLGSRFDQETVRLALTSGVANAYFQVLALRMRLEIARNNLAIAEKLYNIVDARYRNGVASALDLSRQRSTVLAQRATILPLEVQERQALSALAILLGRAPQGFTVQATSLLPLKAPEVEPGLPSSLLSRRPDLASSEAALAGADADVAAARAALLPTVSLTGAAGLSSSSLLTLSNPAYSVQIAASILQTLFDGNRLRSQVQLSESARRQLVEGYRSDVYTALKEVDDALGNAARNREQEQTQLVIRAEAQRALRLSELRFREGSDDFSSLLDAQRSLFSADDSLAQIRLSRLTGAVAVFKALGGGWTQADVSAAEPGPASLAKPAS